MRDGVYRKQEWTFHCLTLQYIKLTIEELVVYCDSNDVVSVLDCILEACFPPASAI